jgi:hypothetical protein
VSRAPLAPALYPAVVALAVVLIALGHMAAMSTTVDLGIAVGQIPGLAARSVAVQGAT